MQFDRMSGLDAEQLDKLEQMVGHLLKKPWDHGKGRPRELALREALIVTSGYMRNNITEQVWAEIFDVDQSTISRYITVLTPLIDQATAEFRPSAQTAAEATRGAIALVDGTLWPCWSWAGEQQLWAGKYKTTGHGSLIVTNFGGRITFVSEPVPGSRHDMAKLEESECELILKLAGDVIGDKGFIGTEYILTPVRKPKNRDLYVCERDYNRQISSLRAPVERAVASLKTWRILFIDYRRPPKTLLVLIPGRYRSILFQGDFCISLIGYRSGQHPRTVNLRDNEQHTDSTRARKSDSGLPKLAPSQAITFIAPSEQSPRRLPPSSFRELEDPYPSLARL